MTRINIGCGLTPTKDWRNFDNSPTLLLAKLGPCGFWAWKAGLLNSEQYAFLKFAQSNDIAYGDATKGLPIDNNTVEVLYSSHMFEHLDRNDAVKFLKEAWRVLAPGGVMRLVVPDLDKLARSYIADGNADLFVESTLLATTSLSTLLSRVTRLVVGFRGHRWMYDGNSLGKLLGVHGFTNIKVVRDGKTMIRDVTPLNLFERSAESVCVEATKP